MQRVHLLFLYLVTMHNFMENIRWIILALSIITIFLHINIWVSENGYQRIRSLSSQINDQREINQVLRDRNNALQAEIDNLRSGNESIEERARSDLGFIKDDEIYYFVVEKFLYPLYNKTYKAPDPPTC